MANTVTTEAFFTGIQSKLLSEIRLAQQTVFVAVAWFTDKELLAALVQKQRDGVQVSLAVTNDEINGAMDFTALTSAGGAFYKIDGALMHNKFCIIDGKDVITGSYNWTYRAATANYENVIITAGDYDLAYRYLNEFKRITGNEINVAAPSTDIAKVIRRLQAICNLIQLEEHDDSLRQARRLFTEWNDPLANKLLANLESSRYASALEELELFLHQQSRVVVYENPLLAALKLEIKDLEYRILAIESESTDAEKVIAEYNHVFTARLGTLVEEVLRLKKEFAHAHRTESQYSQSEYEEAKRRYEGFRQEYETESQKVFYPLDEANRAELKKLYRHCAMLCHPDKVAEEFQEDAQDIFQHLTDVYERQDLTQLQLLADQLAKGRFQVANYVTLDKLQSHRDKLARKLETVLRHLETIQASEVYQQIQQITDLDQHFAAVKSQLEDELTIWKRQSHEQ